MEIGIYTFGDLPAGARGPGAAQQRLKEIIAAAKLADEAGLHVFGVGEHHRSDYAVSAHTVVLGGIAAVTRNIRLTSAVTILSSADPVRVFEDFATLDLLSNGRAELMAGRGAFVESFPLFGFELQDYDALYNEKLELLLKLRANERITWEGRFRPAMDDVEVAPRPLSIKLPIWIGAGGTPQSAVRAGQAGLPLNLANIGGEPARFKPFIDLYRKTGLAAGYAAADLKVAISGHLHLQKDSQRARDEFFPHYTHYMRHNLPQRDVGWTISKSDYAQLASPRGSLFVGSPQEIADKILYEYELFGHQRFLAQIDIGGLPFDKVANVIELLAGEVLPIVKRALGQQDCRGTDNTSKSRDSHESTIRV
jgi:probable LLM family oxidoreductase